MSGGSHNYICFRIQEDLCGRMYDRELNDLMEDIAKLAHDLEWYESADICEEDYKKTVREFKNKWFKSSRTARLKSYIDKEIAEIREQLYTMIGEEQEDDATN